MDSALSGTAAQLKALAHPLRLRIFAALAQGELSVCQITALIGLATSTASEHLAELRSADLVTERKEGRWVFYGLPDHRDLPGWLDELLVRVARDPQLAEDRRVLKALRPVPLEEVCRADRSLDKLGIARVAGRAAR